MAIQLRRGDYADFDPSQLLDGELAVVLENDPNTDDGTGTYVSYGEGNVKRLLTADESVDVDVATTTTPGIVKPDGTTITVDSDGTIHGAADGSIYYANNTTCGWTDNIYYATVDESFQLVKGVVVIIRTISNVTIDSVYATINVNNTGVKDILRGGSAARCLDVPMGVLVPLVYNGTSWEIIGTIERARDKILIGTSSTAGDVATKACDIRITPNFNLLTVAVTFDYDNTAALDSLKLSFTDSTGSNVRKGGQVLTEADNLKAGILYLFRKENAYWDLIGAIPLDGSSVTPSSTAPVMDGTASAGSSTDYARGDHVHPTDTSRAAASALTSHTSDTTAHVTAAERSTWNAKASTATATTSANGLMSSSDKAKLDSIDTSALATATANANTAATAANNAASSANDAADRAEDAIDAIGDISEQAVPLMSDTTRGGAKLGHGLAVEDGALGIGEVTDPTDAGPIVELTAKGWAEQDTTVGKNLAKPNYSSSQNGTISGVTWTYKGNGIWHGSGTSTVSGENRPANGSQTYITEELPAGTYTLSVHVTNSNGYAFARIGTNDNYTAIGVAYENQPTTVTLTGTQQYRIMVGFTTAIAFDSDIVAQLELGSTATPYEPYSGAAPSPSPSYPQEIRRVTGHTIAGKTGRYVDVDVQGRNLLPRSIAGNASGITWTIDDDNSFVLSGTSTAVVQIQFADVLLPAGTYTLSGCPSGGGGNTYTIIARNMDAAADVTNGADGGSGATFTLSVATNVRFRIRVASGVTLSGKVFRPMLELGGTAHSYEPYYHATIPIPLPSRGWVAALPDGTCDTLTLDGAGGYVWTLATWMDTIDGSTNTVVGPTIYDNAIRVSLAAISNLRTSTTFSVGLLSNRLTEDPRVITSSQTVDAGKIAAYVDKKIYLTFDKQQFTTAAEINTWLASNPVTVLYPLATPTTESGYVDMPTVPRHASISSTDLTDLTVRCCADAGAAEISAAWGRKYESRIAALEEIVANLI